MEPCDSIISEIPILTVALLIIWLASYITGSNQNKDLKYAYVIESQGYTIFTLFTYFFMIPILLFKLTIFKLSSK